MEKINKIFPNKKLYLKKIDNNKGWGVFATEVIKKDEIVEICYCMTLHDDKTEFIDYAFGLKSNSTLLPFGFGCIYNHSTTPNINYTLDKYNKLIIFIAITDISKDEEICHNYGTGYLERKPLI
jgi:SET domain-containing protein